MASVDMQILFRIAQWVDDGNRKICKTIRQLAKTEENYLVIIREIDRVRDQCINARQRGARATLTLVEWLTILEAFGWQCAYCRSKPFQVMYHVIPLPEGGTVAENCVPACYRCTKIPNRHIEKNGQRSPLVPAVVREQEPCEHDCQQNTQEGSRQIREVGGAGVEAYMRHQNGISRQILFTSMITFTCTQCGQEVTQPQYPHPVSRYLCFHCEEAAKKESRR